MIPLAAEAAPSAGSGQLILAAVLGIAVVIVLIAWAKWHPFLALILGIGAGWFEKDYTEYGYEFGTAGGRLDDLASALPRIEARFGKLNPAPTRRIPVLVGGGGERKTLRLVARYADIWHSFGDAETIEHKLEVLRRHCADVGRDPAEIEVSTGVRGRGGPGPEQTGPRLREVGASLFTVGVAGPDPDLSGLRAWIAWRDAQRD